MPLVASEPSIPRLEDFVRVLADGNPWRLRGSVPEHLARGTARALGAHLGSGLLEGGCGRHHLICGSRRVGKSTVLYQTVAQLRAAGVAPERLVWVRCEHPLLLGTSVARLLRRWVESVGARPESPAWLFLDEVPFAHDWEHWLRSILAENWPVGVVASASGDVLRDRVLAHGTRAYEEHFLPPCHVAEVVALLGGAFELPLGSTLAETLEACVRAGLNDPDIETRRLLLACAGGFPELLEDVSQVVVLSDLEQRLERSERLLSTEVVGLALYKDLRLVEGLDDPRPLERLLHALAGCMAQALDPGQVCAGLPGLGPGLLERNLADLERAFLVFTLPAHPACGARAARKVFFRDAAVRNAVLRRGLGPLRDPAEMSRITANLAAAHLSQLARLRGAQLFHASEGDLCVDFVYAEAERPLAFALSSDTHRARRALAFLAERHPELAGGCYHVSPLVRAELPAGARDGVGSLPLDLFLLAVAQQVDQEVAWSLRR